MPLLIGCTAKPSITDETIIKITISQGKMKPQEMAFSFNQEKTLLITSDVAAELHIHGYEIKQELSPDQITNISFITNLAGRYPMELHLGDNELEIGSLSVYP